MAGKIDTRQRACSGWPHRRLAAWRTCRQATWRLRRVFSLRRRGLTLVAPGQRLSAVGLDGLLDPLLPLPPLLPPLHDRADVLALRTRHLVSTFRGTGAGTLECVS